jgi:Gamma-glutamyl cyclotransferase, AIG2-like
MSKLYFAYGSNLHKRQMAYRCPDAKAFSLFHLEDWKLVFRGVADIIPSPGDKVSGGLWVVSENDELALDRYEGYRPDGGGMYRKETIAIEPFKIGKETFTEIMFYTMNSDGIMPPSHGYLDTIKQGFKDFGLKLKPLMDAVEAAHDDKNPSHVERRRHQRNGRPAFAPRPSEAKKKKSPTIIRATTTNPTTTNSTTNDKQLSLWRKAMTIYGD